jgi:hypothetical protein
LPTYTLSWNFKDSIRGAPAVKNLNPPTISHALGVLV